MAYLQLRRETEANTGENSRSLEGDSTSLPEERDNISNQVNLSNQKTYEGEMMMACKKVKERGGRAGDLEQQEEHVCFDC